MITNLRYADNIILLATSEAELQELLDRLDRVSRRYSLLVNSDGIACRIFNCRGQGFRYDVIVVKSARCSSGGPSISPS